MLDTAKELAVNKSLDDAEEKMKDSDSEKLAMKTVEEKLKKIELTLEKITETLAKLA